jgi:hypothetical protein
MSPSEPVSERPSEAEPPITPLGAGIDFTDPNSALAPYYLQASHVVAVALLSLVFVFLSLRSMGQSDVWCHLKIGQAIVTTGQLPPPRTLTPFADPQSSYADGQWLSQAALYAVYRAGAWLADGDEIHQTAGGVAILRCGNVLFILARLVVLLVALRRLSGSLPLACAGLFLYVVLSLGQMAVVRPQAVGELFFTCLLLALGRPVLSKRALVLVPIIMVLWANCDGSYLVGLILLAATLAGRAIEAGWVGGCWSLRRAWADAALRRLLLVLLASAAAIALLNPYGILLYAETLRWASNANLGTLPEWQPIAFRLGLGGHWFYLGALLLLIVSQALSPRALTPTHMILLTIFGVWPCLQLRMMAWWLLLVPWLVMPLWAAAGQRRAWWWLHLASVPSFRKTLMAAVLLIVAFLFSMPVQWLRAGGPPPLGLAVSAGTPWQVAAQLKDPNEEWLPTLKQALQQYHRSRFTGYVFASATQGDYLTWALGSDMPVMACSQVHLFAPDYWQEMQTVLQGASGWWEILDRYGANLVVVEAEMYPHLARLLRRDAILDRAAAGGEGVFPQLAQFLRQQAVWHMVLDETGNPGKRDPRTRLLIALRKQPCR